MVQTDIEQRTIRLGAPEARSEIEVPAKLVRAARGIQAISAPNARASARRGSDDYNLLLLTTSKPNPRAFASIVRSSASIPLHRCGRTRRANGPLQPGNTLPAARAAQKSAFAAIGSGSASYPNGLFISPAAQRHSAR